MGLNHEIKNFQKSRDTATLKKPHYFAHLGVINLWLYHIQIVEHVESRLGQGIGFLGVNTSWGHSAVTGKKYFLLATQLVFPGPGFLNKYPEKNRPELFFHLKFDTFSNFGSILSVCTCSEVNHAPCVPMTCTHRDPSIRPQVSCAHCTAHCLPGLIDGNSVQYQTCRVLSHPRHLAFFTASWREYTVLYTGKEGSHVGIVHRKWRRVTLTLAVYTGSEGNFP